ISRLPIEPIRIKDTAPDAAQLCNQIMKTSEARQHALKPSDMPVRTPDTEEKSLSKEFEKSKFNGITVTAAGILPLKRAGAG
ncbi:hypothetical protein HDU97_009477, partial [Phlyctochytrium planicorne]